MRISIIFPLIMWAVLRFRWYVAAGGSVILALVSDYAGHLVGAEANARTGTYVGLFVVGALLAKHNQAVTLWCRRRNLATHVAMTGTGVLFYTYAFWVAPTSTHFHSVLIDLAFVTVGASIFIILALGAPIHQWVLLTRPVIFLGRVSYSLYLVHAVVIMATVRLLDGLLPLPVILLLAVLISLALAALAYRFVERPAIDLGKRLVANRRRLVQVKSVEGGAHAPTPG